MLLTTCTYIWSHPFFYHKIFLTELGLARFHVSSPICFKEVRSLNGKGLNIEKETFYCYETTVKNYILPNL